MPRFEEARALTVRHIAAGDFAGAVIRVELRGELLYEEAFGLALDIVAGPASADPVANRPMRTDTLFDLASVSKLFTTTAILKLASLGRLAPEQPVTDFLNPGSPARAHLEGVDIRALLTHSSGLHYWFPLYTRADLDFDSILTRICEKNPRKPGQVIYSDLNFMLLGRILERVTGQGLRDAVRDLVFVPLDLARTRYGPLPDAPSNLADAGTVNAAATEWGNRTERGMVADLDLYFHGWRDERRPIIGQANDGNCHYFFGGAAGHAGIFSDARDLCALGRAWLDPDLARDALRDHGGERGLGFQTGSLYPGEGWGHTGFTGTMLHVNPRRGLVFALLSNRLHVAEPRNINPWRLAVSEAILADARRSAATASGAGHSKEQAPLDGNAPFR